MTEAHSPARDLSGKVALVTGGRGGIGRAIERRWRRIRAHESWFGRGGARILWRGRLR